MRSSTTWVSSSRPGVGYRAAGERYVRLSLTVADEELEEGVRRLLSWRF